MIVDYSTSGHVCRICLPTIITDTNQPSMSKAKAADDFLINLLPSPLRGKKLRDWSSSTGGHFMTAVEYENVGIGKVSDNTLTRTDVMVTFLKNSAKISLLSNGYEQPSWFVMNRVGRLEVVACATSCPIGVNAQASKRCGNGFSIF